MGDESSFVDLLFVAGALVLIIATSTGFGRRRRGGKAAEGQRTAAVGILIWLGLLGFALYLMFG
jgi:hypothetical protein